MMRGASGSIVWRMNGVRSRRALRFSTRSRTEPPRAAPFDGPQDHRLVLAVVPSHAAPLATDPCFVHFDDARQWDRVLILHGGADAMGQVERSLVGGAEFPLELVCRDALAGLPNQVGGSEPLPEWQMAIGEDRARRDRELVAA